MISYRFYIKSGIKPVNMNLLCSENTIWNKIITINSQLFIELGGTRTINPGNGRKWIISIHVNTFEQLYWNIAYMSTKVLQFCIK